MEKRRKEKIGKKDFIPLPYNETSRRIVLQELLQESVKELKLEEGTFVAKCRITQAWKREKNLEEILMPSNKKISEYKGKMKDDRKDGREENQIKEG